MCLRLSLCRIPRGFGVAESLSSSGNFEIASKRTLSAKFVEAGSFEVLPSQCYTSSFVFRVATHRASSSTLIPQILNLYRLSADENRILRFIIEAASCFFFFYRGWSTRTPRNMWIRSCMNEESSSHVQTYMRRRTCRSYWFRKSGRWVYLTKLILRRFRTGNWIEIGLKPRSYISSSIFACEIKEWRGAKRRRIENERREIPTTAVDEFNRVFFTQIQRFTIVLYIYIYIYDIISWIMYDCTPSALICKHVTWKLVRKWAWQRRETSCTAPASLLPSS